MPAAPTPAAVQPPIAVATAGWLGLGCGLAAAVLFAGKAVLVRLAYAHGGEATALAGLRMAASLPCFALVAWWSARREGPLARGDTIRLLLLGVLGYHLASWLDFAGLHHIDAPLERVVLFIYPTIVVAVGVWRGRTAVTGRLIVALLATYGGIVATWGDRLRFGHGSALGVALVGASAVIFAVYMVLSEDLIRRVGGVRAMATAMLGGCATTIAHAAIAAPASGWAPNATVVGCGLLLALTATVIPVLLAGIATARLGASRAALVACVAPAATALISWAVVGEHLGALGWIGIALTTAGAVLVGKPRPP